ncbi:MAG: glycosyltransferase [Cyanobacteria bacterium J06650_10]
MLSANDLLLNTILAIIPALNEEATIVSVIENLKLQGINNILVVDNGSLDCTVPIVASTNAAVVIEQKRGYGQACWCGLETQAAAEADWVLFCDGDGSDDLSQLPEMLALREQYDFVLGNRRGTREGRSHLTLVQNFGNWLATRLIWLGWGYRYEDLGPLRLIRKQALDRLEMADRGFGWTVEMQAKAAEQGLRICELPVSYRPRQGGESKISGTVRGSVQAGWVILSTLMSLYWRNRWRQVRSVVMRRARVHQAKVHQAGVRQGRMQQGLLWAIAFLFMVGSILAMPHGDFLNQPTAVPLFWRGVGLMSVGFGLAWLLEKVGVGWFWVIAIAPRLILLAMYPSDDIWRYLWEGHIQTQGFNPYLVPPDADVLQSLRFAWWGEINHPDLAAIYPPITQLGFRLLAAVSPTVLMFKSAFVAADLLICGLLARRFGYRNALLYAWNPLVIYSIAGGGHYDSWFLLPLVVAWLWWDWPWLSALMLGVSIGVKWMSLPVLGLLIWRVWWPAKIGHRWGWATLLLLVGLWVGLLPVAIATVPFCQAAEVSQAAVQGLHCPVIPLSSPFVIYGRSAALIPQFVSMLWPASLKMNWIYVLPLALSVFWNFRRSVSVSQFIERYLVVLMLLSPIIHAWYFVWLAPFAVASRSWGTRLVSISAFVYFALPHGLALGADHWTLSPVQKALFWGPFIFGEILSWNLASSQRPFRLPAD